MRIHPFLEQQLSRERFTSFKVMFIIGSAARKRGYNLFSLIRLFQFNVVSMVPLTQEVNQKGKETAAK